MSDTVIVAMIAAGGSVVGSVTVSVTALLLNFRLFNSLERRIEVLEADIKLVVSKLADLDARMSTIEERIKG